MLSNKKKYIEVIINKKTGQITAEGVGYKGKSCEEVAELMASIGGKVNKQYKPEYRQEEQVMNQGSHD